MATRVNLPPDYDAFSNALEHATAQMSVISAWSRMETYDEYLRAELIMKEVRLELESIFHVIRLTAVHNDHGTEGFIASMQFALHRPCDMLADTISEHDKCLRVALDMELFKQQIEPTIDGWDASGNPVDRPNPAFTAAETTAASRYNAATRMLVMNGRAILACIKGFAQITDRMLRVGGPMDVIVGRAMERVSEDWADVGVVPGGARPAAHASATAD